MRKFPDNWDLKPLSSVTLPISKTSPVATGRSNIRYVDIGSIAGPTRHIPELPLIESATAPSRARQVVQAGDTLFSTVRPYLEKIAFVGTALEGEFASTGFSVLRPGDELLPEYLYYYMTSKTLLDQVLPLQKGVSYPAVLDREVKAAKIPLPPLSEQRQIVEILEDHLSRLDAANTAIHRAALRVRQLVKASSTTIVNRAESDNRTTTLRLEDIASLGSGTTPARGNPRYWDQGTIPWVTSGDLSQGVITSSSQFVTDAALSETSLRILPAGTLLVAMYGEGKTRGTVGELAIDATSNQACAAITLNNSNTTHRSWLRLVLESRYETLRRQSSGGVQPNLNIGLLRNLTVPWPTAEHAATLVDEHRRTIDMARRLETGLRTNLLRSRSLHRALLAAAFSGQLTGTPPELGKIAEQVAASGAH